MTFPNDLCRLCLQKLKELPRTGKPTENEWTVLSAIVEHNCETNSVKVVSLGTGTKCLGGDQLCAKGLILNDSHAEVMARRGFLRYIYAHIRDPNSEVLKYNGGTRKFHLADGITFHFFSTHSPCGDASVATFQSSSPGGEEPPEKRTKFSNEMFTGARLLVLNENTDSMAQDEGAVRTKPGRGIRTLSVSCSDKLARWNVMGIQGALLDCFLDSPIYLASYTFCGKVDEKSVRRAIWDRWRCNFDCERFRIQERKIQCVSDAIEFEWSQTDGKDPSPASIVWCDVSEKSTEVAVAGKRQGITKKNHNTLIGSLKISKAWLFKDFLNVLNDRPELKEHLKVSENIADMTYHQVKNLSKEYQLAWNVVKEKVFKNWTTKPTFLLEFKVEL